ncbi:hypothetical protein M404DRAFT_35489 [Pisolithus tinctorius Marx 270]|uniref:Zn(2)-C6 fungal-type domain-containing protein n=1 Tax=Pisolithus tinctorius Marx 270 TaxID=870435 RepID=A0A0C3NDY0_PISTI|nr:hypothetical protein M404DRAFT_35489 [Pisolithus tinctorius Marx 270]
MTPIRLILISKSPDLIGLRGGLTEVGKGKEKATDKVDELENDKGEHPPNPDPSKTGALAPDANLQCRECTKVNAECEGLPGESCEQCRQAKWKCSWSLRVGRKHKNTGSGEMAAGPSHKWTKSVTVMVTTGLKLRIPARKPLPRKNSKPTPRHPTPHASPPSTSNMPPPPTPQPPLFLPSATPAPRPHPELTPPPMDNPGDLGDSGLFGRPMGLLDDPPMPIVSAQDESKDPPVAETLPVTNPSESTMCEALAECIRLLEGRADDEEFELTQIHQMLGLLATQVERQIGTVQGRHEELKRLKDQLKDM